MVPTSDLVKLFDGRHHSVVSIQLARLESGEQYVIQVLRHLPGARIKPHQFHNRHTRAHMQKYPSPGDHVCVSLIQGNSIHIQNVTSSCKLLMTIPKVSGSSRRYA